MIKVPPLSLPQLEERANLLLAEYADTIGGDVPNPIPVTDIAENELGLNVECRDLHAYFNVPKQSNTSGILGAMEFASCRILIDQSLNPEIHPHRIGRYRYSIAHEIGHWRLHRAKVLQSRAPSSQPPVICREPRPKMPVIEWQAENFASFLLLPRDRVLDAWGAAPPFLFDVNESGSRELRALWFSKNPDEDITRAMFARECEKRFEQLAEPLAWSFEVSKQAMCIRLEGMGLLRRTNIGHRERSLT